MNMVSTEPINKYIILDRIEPEVLFALPPEIITVRVYDPDVSPKMCRLLCLVYQYNVRISETQARYRFVGWREL